MFAGAEWDKYTVQNIKKTEKVKCLNWYKLDYKSINIQKSYYIVRITDTMIRVYWRGVMIDAK